MLTNSRKFAQVSLAAAIAFGLFGCGTGGEKSQRLAERKAPAPLPKVTGGGLAKTWSKDTGGSFKVGYATIVPAIGADRVFTASSDGKVSAFATETGALLWESKTEDGISAGVGFGASLAVVATTEGRVVGFDANNGTKVWSSYVGGEVLAQPVVANDVVLIRTVDGKVLGLRVTSGERDWAFQRSVPGLSLRGTGRPVVFEGVAVNGFSNGKIVASEVDTGRVLWELGVSKTRGRNEIERLIDIDAQPLLIGSVLYTAAYQGEISALALGSRKVLWRSEISSHRELDSDDNHIFVTTDDGVVVALDRLNGVERWRQTGLEGRDVTGPTLAQGKLLVGDADGFLHVLDPTTGQIQGRSKVSGSIARRSETDGRRVYTLSRNGELTVFQSR